MSSCRFPKGFENSLFGLLNLVLEVDTLLVLDKEPFLVAHIGLSDQFVFLFRFIHTFVPSFVSHTIELLSTICGCDHMNNGIVPVVSNLLSSDPHVIKNCLPLSVGYISLPIHKTSVDQNHHVSFLIFHGHLSNVSKLIFESHLQSHQCFLEVETLGFCETSGHDESSTRHKQSGCLGDDKTLNAELLEILLNLRNGGSFACTRTSRETNPYNIGVSNVRVSSLQLQVRR